MRIGELAEHASVHPRTVRFYERLGLLREPERTASGYRDYDDQALNRLTFIRNAQAAGLTLNEIGGITQLRDEGTTPCTHVTELLDTKLDHVRQTIKQLRTLEHELVALVKRSRTLDPADCTDRDTCHILGSHQELRSRVFGRRPEVAVTAKRSSSPSRRGR